MKKFFSVLTALFICLSFYAPAEAAEYRDPSIKYANDIVFRAEQTKWYYRTYNGQYQKRLWSITEGHWLTDWMPA